MKTTDPRDPLDQKIDALLANRPLPNSDNFTQRVLAATQAETTPSTTTQHKHWLRYAMPLAAAILVAFTLTFTVVKPKPAQQFDVLSSVSVAEVQEILLIEDGLGELAKLEETLGLTSDNLALALESLYSDLKS